MDRKSGKDCIPPFTGQYLGPDPQDEKQRRSEDMAQHLKIDFVSDVACPWCIIGLKGLEEALAQASDAVEADITFQPFELNPSMPAEGQNDRLLPFAGKDVSPCNDHVNFISAGFDRASDFGYALLQRRKSSGKTG